MNDQGYEIRLRNAEGVPILHLAGDITKSALNAVKTTLDHLASAGHYNIVLNIERAHLVNMSFLTGLADAARNIRAHYGAVDLIVSDDARKQLPVASQITRLFRLCASESQAILQIKRLARRPDALNEANARILEKS
jgi:anti-anti-sigma regulatory factor